MKTIELDCPPGNPRPGDLIEGVIKDTGLPLKQPSAMFFGNWVWAWPEVSDEDWKKAQEITIPRIKALYNAGIIRYGSW